MEGSKPLSAEELEKYRIMDSVYGRYLSRDYPKFISRISDLRAKGVNTYDLTQLFQGHTETLYRDHFCHFNPSGNDLIAHEIGKYILQYFDTQPVEEKINGNFFGYLGYSGEYEKNRPEKPAIALP